MQWIACGAKIARAFIFQSENRAANGRSDSDQLIQLDDRQQDREHDEENERAHGEDERRLEHAGEQAHSRLVLDLLLTGGLAEHVREPPARLAGGDEMDEDRRKEPAARESAVQARAFAHALLRLL